MGVLCQGMEDGGPRRPRYLPARTLGSPRLGVQMGALSGRKAAGGGNALMSSAAGSTASNVRA